MKLITNKSKNLLYRIVNEGNTTVQFGTSYAVATQISADSVSVNTFKIQGYDGTKYTGLGGASLSIGKITITFTTPSTTGFKLIRFGLNGASIDTLCRCDMDLKPSTTYTFTCNFTNITQGSISWKDMMLVEGSTVGDYEPYSYNLLDKNKFLESNSNYINNGDGSITTTGIDFSFQKLFMDFDSDDSSSISKENSIAYLTYGHKILIDDNGNSTGTAWSNAAGYVWELNSTSANAGGSYGGKGEIFTNNKLSLADIKLSYFYMKNNGGEAVACSPALYDLTLMYGAGNEPTTVSQFYTDHPELKVSPLGFIGLKNLEISNKNIKRLKYKTSSGSVDLGIIPSNSGYILDKYNNLSEELLEENIEKDTVNYHIPNKTNISLNKVEGKINKIVQLLDKSTVNCSSVNDWIGGTGSDTNLRVANGVVSIDGTLGSYSGVHTQFNTSIIKGHKYYLSIWAMCSKNASNVLLPYTYGFNSSTLTLTANEWKNAEKIAEANISDDTSIGVRYGDGESSEETVTWSAKRPQLFDLTAMYGFGNEPTTVEQFKKDYPQFFDEKLDGIWNVRTSGISTTGKNLLDISKWITSRYDIANGTLVERLSNGAVCQGNNGTGDGDGSYSNGWFRPMNNSPYSNQVHLQAGTYTLSADYTMIENSVVSTAQVSCHLYGDNNYPGSAFTSAPVGSTVKVKNTYTVEEGYYYPVFTLNSGKAKIENIQIELNSTATAYEHYTENKIDLLSTQTLNGINGVNDYIEVIDKGNGLYDLKKTQNIDSVDLGSLGFDVEGSNFVSGAMSSDIKPPANDNSVGNYICQKYVNCALNKSFVNGDFGVNSSGYVYFRNSTYTTANDFNAAVTGIMLYYQLKTPVVTTIATNLTYNQVSAIRTNGGLLLVNDNNNQKYVQPDVTLKENYQYKNG